MIHQLDKKDIEYLININISEMSKLLDRNGFKSIELSSLTFHGISTHTLDFIFDIVFQDDMCHLKDVEASLHVNIQDGWKVSFYI